MIGDLLYFTPEEREKIIPVLERLFKDCNSSETWIVPSDWFDKNFVVKEVSRTIPKTTTNK